MIKRIFSLTLGFFLAIPLAQADVTILQDNSGTSFVGSSGESSNPTNNPLSGMVSSMSGSGFGDAFSDFGWGINDSFFDVSFSTSEHQSVFLQGSFSGSGGDFGVGGAGVNLFNLQTNTSIFGETLSVFGQSFESKSFDFIGLLAPGEYRLRVSTSLSTGGFDTFGSWSFTADYTAVPVPASLWFMASGLAALLYRARTTKRIGRA